MPYDIRQLTEDDRAAAYRLGSLAFGYHDHPMPNDYKLAVDGHASWGVFDGGQLLAKAVDRVQGQWFGGRIVPTCGVAGVAVIPEARGAGLGRIVLTRLLAQAKERGAGISTLFPSTPFPYRALGWEEVGALTYIGLPTAALTTARGPKVAADTRTATEQDIPAMEELYRGVAQASAGMMERTGPLFPAKDWIEDFDGVSVAMSPEGTVDGYMSWDRGKGSDPDSRVTAYDLIGNGPQATRALLGILAGWASVAPTTVLRVTAPDPALFGFATSSAWIDKRQPWMLRVVDAATAVAGRGWPAHLTGQVNLALADDLAPWHEGPRKLVLDGGTGRLETGGSGQVRLTPRGLALWYAGAATPSVLRRAGFLTDGDEHTDAFLQAATAGPAPTLHDHF